MPMQPTVKIHGDADSSGNVTPLVRITYGAGVNSTTAVSKLISRNEVLTAKNVHHRRVITLCARSVPTCLCPDQTPAEVINSRILSENIYKTRGSRTLS